MHFIEVCLGKHGLLSFTNHDINLNTNQQSYNVMSPSLSLYVDYDLKCYEILIYGILDLASGSISLASQTIPS